MQPAQLTPEEELQYTKHIIEAGNEILTAFQADGLVDDISMFQYDNFYLQIFQEILPEQGMMQLQPGNTAEEMAANIDYILDVVEKVVPEFDIYTLNGDMIVQGDLQQLAAMLDLV